MSVPPRDLLADRDSWSAASCSMDAALGVVGTRSAMLLLREAIYGTQRFDDFVRRTGLTEAVTANRLKELVSYGLLDRQPYQVPGQRERMEYRLTQKGRELLPAIVALMQWGDRWLTPDRKGPVKILHRDCGHKVSAVLECSAGHHPGQHELLLVRGSRSLD